MLHSRRLPWPVDWEAVFAREAPLWIEIGFGNGQFLLNLAGKRPYANILGLEISLPSLRRGEKKLKQRALSHVRVMQGDATMVLWALCQPETVDAIIINFPDPWPKSSHQRRRLISERFLHLAATRMVSGALLEIATDHAAYAAVIADCLAQTPYFESRLRVPFATEDEARFHTKYELKALAEGRRCYYFEWRRNAIAAPDDFPVPKELTMPHVVLQSPLSLNEMARQFEPSTVSAGSTHVKLIEIYHSLQSNKLLVEAYVNEEPIEQRVGLVIRHRKTGDFVIGLHEVGFPRPTSGIHLAVDHLVQWMVSLHPEAQIVHSNLQILSEAGDG